MDAELFEPGTVWVTPDGAVYRLRDYGIDWQRKPFTGDKEIPSYNVQTSEGMTTSSKSLPADSVIVWSPDLGSLRAYKENPA